jgi:2-C-methyl-D-erythritol 4-phosphate cytidylyltransferase
MIDSATLMTHYGATLHIVEGPVENIKITTPADFYIFRAITEAKENSQIWGI